jgi:hypothetical protein
MEYLFSIFQERSTRGISFVILLLISIYYIKKRLSLIELNFWLIVISFCQGILLTMIIPGFHFFIFYNIY